MREPEAGEPTVASDGAEGSGATAGKAPILLVDDRPGNLLALESILDSPGYEVVSVASGAEALAATARRDFAVILLDVMMPDMDGLDTVRAMRRTQALPTPV